MTPEDYSTRFEAFRVPIAKFLFRRVDANDVDDLASEVFGIAWRRGSTVSPGDELPWLYRVANNLVANHRRKNATATRFLASVIAPDTAPSAESIAIVDISLADAWGRLPANSREVLALAALDGLSVTEIASMLDISSNAVSVRLSRARQQLREALSETA